MTEAEWLASDNPGVMLSLVSHALNDRKLRLFGCGCFRRRGINPSELQAIDAAEAYADGRITEEALAIASRIQVPNPTLGNVAVLITGFVPFYEGMAATFGSVVPDACDVLRDIFGNPFRAVALDPAWGTGNVVALAQTIYDERGFDRMPILADALEDAGCTSGDMLNHCRMPGVHVRGCWVVDLVLAKG